MANDDRLKELMNKNIKMSPWIIAFAWDVWFVWTISTMFLSNVKGFSYSQVVMLDSFLMAFGAVFCLIVGKVFKKVSPIICTRIGMLGYGAFLLLNIFGTHYATFVFAQAFLAYGYSMCGIKCNSFVNDSLVLINKQKSFDKVSGRGISLVYIMECVGAIVITYIYNWNAYMAFWVAFAVVVISEVFSFFATDTQKFIERNVEVDAEVKTVSVQKKKAMKKEMLSMFVISVLVFCFFFRGTTSPSVSAYKIFLQQSQERGMIPAWLFGYLFAIGRLAMAFASKYQFKLSLRFGIKTILSLIMTMVFSIFIVGGLNLLFPDEYWSFAIVLIFYCVLVAVRPPLQIMTSNYINRFVSRANVDLVYSLKMLFEYAGYAIFSLIFSTMLDVYNDNLGMVNLVFVLIAFIPLIVSTILFIRALFVKFREKQTIIKKEYTED